MEETYGPYTGMYWSGRQMGKIFLFFFFLAISGKVFNTYLQKSTQKNQDVFVKHYAPGSNKVQKAIFSFKVKVKVIIKVIDLGVIWKGVFSGVCMPKMKSLSVRVQKLKQMLKLTTDKQTDRQTNS